MISASYCCCYYIAVVEDTFFLPAPPGQCPEQLPQLPQPSFTTGEDEFEAEHKMHCQSQVLGVSASKKSQDCLKNLNKCWAFYLFFECLGCAQVLLFINKLVPWDYMVREAGVFSRCQMPDTGSMFSWTQDHWAHQQAVEFEGEFEWRIHWVVCLDAYFLIQPSL